MITFHIPTAWSYHYPHSAFFLWIFFFSLLYTFYEAMSCCMLSFSTFCILYFTFYFSLWSLCCKEFSNHCFISQSSNLLMCFFLKCYRYSTYLWRGYEVTEREAFGEGDTKVDPWARKKNKGRDDPCLLSNSPIFYLAQLQRKLKVRLPLWPWPRSLVSFPGSKAYSDCRCSFAPAPEAEPGRLLQAAIQDGQFAILAKSIYWKLMRHK